MMHSYEISEIEKFGKLPECGVGRARKNFRSIRGALGTLRDQLYQIEIFAVVEAP
jgi:hypothetical protein